MTCVHLKKLYQLCQDEGLRVSSSYLIHFACDQCNVKEVCPSTIVDISEPDNDREPTRPDGSAPRNQPTTDESSHA